MELPGDLTYCDLADFQTNPELNHQIENLNLLPPHCEYKCPIPCEETQYKYTSTLLEFPVEDNNFERSYFNRHGHILGLGSNPSKREIHNAIREEVLKFEVDLESLDMESSVIKPKFDWVHLLSEIGGALGLYTGVSIISAFEIIQLSFDMIFTSWKRLWKKSGKRNIVQVKSAPTRREIVEERVDYVSETDGVLSISDRIGYDRIDFRREPSTMGIRYTAGST